VAHKWITNGQNRTGPFVDQSQFNSLTKKTFHTMTKRITWNIEDPDNWIEVEYSDGDGSDSEGPPVVAAVIPNSPVRGQYSKQIPKEDKRRSARNKRKPATSSSSSSSSKKQKLAPKEDDPFYLEFPTYVAEINDNDLTVNLEDLEKIPFPIH
jgi:hypothetical protein